MPGPAGAGRTPVGRKVLFAGLVSLGVLALGELAVRLSGVVASPVYASPKGLTWAMKPNMPNAPISTGDGLRFSVSTNSVGLRTPYEPGPAQAGVKTLIVLGDSIIFGWGVADHGSLPAQLEQAIPQQGVPQPWRVINGGQPGYSTAQSYMLLRELGLDYAPDLVFLELAGHNLRLSERSDLEIINGSSSAVASALSGLHLYRLLEKAVRPEVTDRGAFWQAQDEVWGQNPTPGQVTEERRVPSTDLALILAELGELGRAHGFTTVVSQPTSFRQPDAAYKAVLQAAHDAGDIVWLDCGQQLSRAGLNHPSYWVDNAFHWNLQGARAASQVTARCLAQEGLLQ